MEGSASLANKFLLPHPERYVGQHDRFADYAPLVFGRRRQWASSFEHWFPPWECSEK
jgi:hypothetical protein